MRKLQFKTILFTAILPCLMLLTAVRHCPAQSANQQGNQLFIHGTGGADDISVWQNAGAIEVDLDGDGGVDQQFFGVSFIDVIAGQGNDYIEIMSPISCNGLTVDPGSGRDSIVFSGGDVFQGNFQVESPLPPSFSGENVKGENVNVIEMFNVEFSMDFVADLEGESEVIMNDVTFSRGFVADFHGESEVSLEDVTSSTGIVADLHGESEVSMVDVTMGGRSTIRCHADRNDQSEAIIEIRDSTLSELYTSAGDEVDLNLYCKNCEITGLKVDTEGGDDTIDLADGTTVFYGASINTGAGQDKVGVNRLDWRYGREVVVGKLEIDTGTDSRDYDYLYIVDLKTLFLMDIATGPGPDSMTFAFSTCVGPFIADMGVNSDVIYFEAVDFLSKAVFIGGDDAHGPVAERDKLIGWRNVFYGSLEITGFEMIDLDRVPSWFN